MTEIPDHLLARSRARRAAIGGGGDGEGEAAPAAAAPAGASGESAAVATTPVAAAPVEAPPPPPPPPYVQAALSRPRVPKYALGVLAALPVWGFVYFGTLTPEAGEQDPVLALGRSVYEANCASCHGATGGGGAGRPLDEVVAVFPDRADHVAWVRDGNVDLAPGTPYGVNRQAKSGYGVMPAFGQSLSEEEIEAVVTYERQEFGGEAPTPATAEGGADDTSEAERTGGDVGGDATSSDQH